MRVLAVDDFPDVALSVAMGLEWMGHTTRAVTVPGEALEAALEFRPDGVICELGMANVDGFALPAQFGGREVLSWVRFIALSRFGRAEMRERARAAGFRGYLVKGATAEEIAAAVAACCTGAE